MLCRLVGLQLVVVAVVETNLYACGNLPIIKGKSKNVTFTKSLFFQIFGVHSYQEIHDQDHDYMYSIENMFNKQSFFYKENEYPRSIIIFHFLI